MTVSELEALLEATYLGKYVCIQFGNNPAHYGWANTLAVEVLNDKYRYKVQLEDGKTTVMYDFPSIKEFEDHVKLVSHGDSTGGDGSDVLADI